jgi:hypothetical protein
MRTFLLVAESLQTLHDLPPKAALVWGTLEHSISTAFSNLVEGLYGVPAIGEQIS